MPRANYTGYSNADVDREPDLYAQQGGSPSAGTSSSTSEKKPEWSGSLAQEMDQSTQSPAQYAENPFGLDQAATPAPSFTAPSTSGSTPETGPDQQSPQDSSAEDIQVVPATPATSDEKKNASEMLRLARESFDSEDYDMAEEFLDEALTTDPSLQDEISEARAQILNARAIRGK